MKLSQVRPILGKYAGYLLVLVLIVFFRPVERNVNSNIQSAYALASLLAVTQPVSNASGNSVLVQKSLPYPNTNSSYGLAYKDINQARDWFLISLENGKNRDTAKFLVGNLFAIEGETDIALDYWRSVGFKASFLDQLGSEYYSSRQFEEAMFYYDLASALSPDDITFECHQAQAYDRAGYADEIVDRHIESIKSWLGVGETIPLGCLYIAGIWARDQGDHDLALQFWTPIIEIQDRFDQQDNSIRDEQIAYVHMQFADSYQDRGDVDRERYFLEKTLYWGENIDTWYTQQARQRLDEMLGE